jgi:hypothetical protein
VPGHRLKSVAVPFVFVLAMLGSPAYAQGDAAEDQKEEARFPHVGSDDIFGFTSPSELGDTGDTGFANENDGRIGKRQGSYGALNTKYEFSYNISSTFWVAASGFLSRNRVRNVPGMPDVSSFDFDGFSFEVARNVIERSETNPWSVTLSVEPRWGRIDGETGLQSRSLGFEAKMFVDRVLIPERLFWAANLVWAPQWSQDPFTPGNQLLGSTDTVSTALTWQVSPGVYVGAETRYMAQFARISSSHLQGQSVYLGPTVLWKINDKVALNATFQPQVWGRSSATPQAALDLDNFERSLFRFKLAWQLN